MSPRQSLPAPSSTRNDDAARWRNKLSRGLDKEDGAERAKYLVDSRRDAQERVMLSALQAF